MPVRLFVGNLPYETSEADLRQHFAAIGPLSHVFMPVDRETGRPRGFAFVEYPDKALAEAAVARLNNQPFKGRTLSVSEARARDDRPAGGGGYGGGSGPGGPRPGGPPGPRPEWSPRPPRPMGGPGGTGGPGGPPAAGAPGKNFGPDAPRRGKAKPIKRREEGPKGPIRVKSGGRIYAVDDFEDQNADEPLPDDLLLDDPLAKLADDVSDDTDDASDNTDDDAAGK
jgi:RNA recognition motif-containing protein